MKRLGRCLIIDEPCAFSQALGAALEHHGWLIHQEQPRRALQLQSLADVEVVLWDIEAGSAVGQHLARLLGDDAKPALIPMAGRPDRRYLPAAHGVAPLIDKFQSVNVAVVRITHFLIQRQAYVEAEAERQLDIGSGKGTMRSQMAFLARISHELRTPLNAIIGFSDLMMNDRVPLDVDQHRQFAADINVSGRHLLDVINDILDFARAESGKLTLHESECELEEIFTSISRLMGPRAREAGLQINFSLGGSQIVLWCDERKLRRMLQNVITNAITATPSGGEINVEAQADDAGLIIAIKDTGAGIPAADLERVLEPFVQVDNSLSRRHEGTGLGLPLVKAMVELHGGKIELKSKLKKGTTVTLMFPRERLASYATNQTGEGVSVLGEDAA